MIIEYDGTDFAGWQVQPGQRTVQGEIEKALAAIFQQPVRIAGAGRTDAGVHAKGQVANFTVSSEIATDRIAHAVNGSLPRDIAIIEACEVPEGFSARYNASCRTYRYMISDQRTAIERNHIWECKYKLSRDLLVKAVEPLKGRLDLKAFSKGGEDEDYETIIFNNSWTFRDNFMIFEISAIRFFHNAVRRIIGSAAEVARGAETPDLFERMLATGDRSLSGPTAPASGLCLIRVDYGEMP